MFAIGKALDAVGERKIFAEILSTDAFGLLAQHLVKNFDKLRVGMVGDSAQNRAPMT
jgi:hypothetical protein